MIAFYVFGGGFGHLSRIKTFIANVDLQEPFMVLTNNKSAFQVFDDQQIAFLPAACGFEAESLKKWIGELIAIHSIQAFYIDTFPCGILGELSEDLFTDIPVHYLCRRLQWHKYKINERPPAIECAYIFESLEPDHLSYVSNARVVKHLQLSFPPPGDTPLAIKHFDRPIWLVVHTTHVEEVEVLIDQALDLAKLEGSDPHMVVLCDQPVSVPKGVTLFHGERPIDWYPHVEKIFTAAGFNTWYQLKPWRSRHVVIPFPRKFDDQFWRAGQKL